MNDNLVEALPGRVGRIATNTLAQNDVNSLFFYPPCSGTSGCNGARSPIQGSSLPVHGRGLGFAELCKAASEGSDGKQRLNFDKLGYPSNKGPYTGGGSSSNPHVKDYISKETGVAGVSLGRALQLFKEAYPYPEPWWGTGSSPLYEEDQSEDENEFTRKMDTVWNSVCGSVTSAVISVVDGLLGGVLGDVMPQPYVLGRDSSAGNIAIDLGNLFGASSFLGTFSAACVQLPKDFQFLAYAARGTHSRISVGIYESALPGDYAYGQSCVYNPQSFDLYTQNWQAKMMPAKHMDDPDSVLSALDTRGPDEFSALVNALKRAGNTDAFQVINVH
jgi:hypothetical protein